MMSSTSQDIRNCDERGWAAPISFGHIKPGDCIARWILDGSDNGPRIMDVLHTSVVTHKGNTLKDTMCVEVNGGYTKITSLSLRDAGYTMDNIQILRTDESVYSCAQRVDRALDLVDTPWTYELIPHTKQQVDMDAPMIGNCQTLVNIICGTEVINEARLAHKLLHT